MTVGRDVGDTEDWDEGAKEGAAFKAADGRDDGLDVGRAVDDVVGMPGGCCVVVDDRALVGAADGIVTVGVDVGVGKSIGAAADAGVSKNVGAAVQQVLHDWRHAPPMSAVQKDAPKCSILRSQKESEKKF